MLKERERPTEEFFTAWQNLWDEAARAGLVSAPDTVPPADEPRWTDAQWLAFADMQEAAGLTAFPSMIRAADCARPPGVSISVFMRELQAGGWRRSNTVTQFAARLRAGGLDMAKSLTAHKDDHGVDMVGVREMAKRTWRTARQLNSCGRPGGRLTSCDFQSL